MTKKQILVYVGGRYQEIMDFWGQKNMHDGKWTFTIVNKKNGERGLIHEGDSQKSIDNKLHEVLFR